MNKAPICPEGRNSVVCYLTCITECTETKIYSCPVGREQKRPKVGGKPQITKFFRPCRGTK